MFSPLANCCEALCSCIYFKPRLDQIFIIFLILESVLAVSKIELWKDMFDVLVLTRSDYETQR